MRPMPYNESIKVYGGFEMKKYYVSIEKDEEGNWSRTLVSLSPIREWRSFQTTKMANTPEDAVRQVAKMYSMVKLLPMELPGKH